MYLKERFVARGAIVGIDLKHADLFCTIGSTIDTTFVTVTTAALPALENHNTNCTYFERVANLDIFNVIGGHRQHRNAHTQQTTDMEGELSVQSMIKVSKHTNISFDTDSNG